MKLLPLAIVQSLLLAGGQVFLKLALGRMEPFGWCWRFWSSVLTNWQFALCGLLYAAGTILWFYIIKHFPFSIFEYRVCVKLAWMEFVAWATEAIFRMISCSLSV